MVHVSEINTAVLVHSGDIFTNGYLAISGVDSEFQWFDKTSTRLPESLMFTYTTAPVSQFTWKLSKLGQLVDPTNVILNGSQYQHGKSYKFLFSQA